MKGKFPQVENFQIVVFFPQEDFPSPHFPAQLIPSLGVAIASLDPIKSCERREAEEDDEEEFLRVGRGAQISLLLYSLSRVICQVLICSFPLIPFVVCQSFLSNPSPSLSLYLSIRLSLGVCVGEWVCRVLSGSYRTHPNGAR